MKTEYIILGGLCVLWIIEQNKDKSNVKLLPPPGVIPQLPAPAPGAPAAPAPPPVPSTPAPTEADPGPGGGTGPGPWTGQTNAQYWQIVDAAIEAFRDAIFSAWPAERCEAIKELYKSHDSYFTGFLSAYPLKYGGDTVTHDIDSLSYACLYSDDEEKLLNRIAYYSMQ